MEKPNVRIVSVAEAKSAFSEIIKHGFARAEHLIVEKRGVPVAAIMPMADYRQLVGAQVTTAEEGAQPVDVERKRAEASRRLGELLAQVHATMPAVEDEEEAERFIQQEVDAMRAERAKKILAESRATYSTRRRTRKKR